MCRPQILDVLRLCSQKAIRSGRELFRCIAMNIAISNDDDHARNYAARLETGYLNVEDHGEGMRAARMPSSITVEVRDSGVAKPEEKISSLDLLEEE